MVEKNIFILPLPIEIQFHIFYIEHKLKFQKCIKEIIEYNFNKCEYCNKYFNYPYYYCRSCSDFTCVCQYCRDYLPFYDDSECEYCHYNT